MRRSKVAKVTPERIVTLSDSFLRIGGIPPYDAENESLKLRSSETNCVLNLRLRL